MFHGCSAQYFFNAYKYPASGIGSHGPCAHGLFVEIKFYQNTAMPVPLHVVFDCDVAPVVSVAHNICTFNPARLCSL